MKSILCRADAYLPGRRFGGINCLPSPSSAQNQTSCRDTNQADQKQQQFDQRFRYSHGRLKAVDQTAS